MTTKKDAAPVQVPNEEAIPAPEVKTLQVIALKPHEPTIEELKKQVANLQRKISAVPEDFDRRIEYFNQKRELIRRLSVLNSDRDNLSGHLDSLSEIAAANEFENDDYFLNIEAGGKYSKKAIFTLKNPVIIADLITFIVGRIDAKREVLKKEIEA